MFQCGAHHRARGTPSVGSALLHLVTSIPAAIVLWVVGMVSGVLWLIAALGILLGGQVPQWVFDLQRGVLRMFARFVAHHASLVEGAAPVRFETGPDSDTSSESAAVTTP